MSNNSFSFYRFILSIIRSRNESIGSKTLFVYNSYDYEDYIKILKDYIRAKNSIIDGSTTYFYRAVFKAGVYDYYGAFYDFNKAIKLDSNDYRLYAGRGAVKFELGGFYGAISDYDLAIELNSKDGILYNNRAYYKKFINDQSYDEDYKKAKELNPIEFGSPILSSIGSIYPILDYKTALVAYHKEIELTKRFRSPNKGFRSTCDTYELNAYITIIQNYFKFKQISIFKYKDDYQKNAIDDYQKKDKVDYFDPYQKAIPIEQSIEENSENAYEYFVRAAKYQSDGNFLNALKDINKAIKLVPILARLYFYRANIKDKLNDHIGSLEDNSMAIFINNNLPEAYYNRGSDKYYLNNDIEALDDYNKAIELDKNRNAEEKRLNYPRYENRYKFFNNRGAVKFILKDYKGALNDFDYSISLCQNKSKITEIYYNRGVTKYMLSEYFDAISDHDYVLKRNPKHLLA